MKRITILAVLITTALTSWAQDTDATLKSSVTTEIKQKPYSPTRNGDMLDDIIDSKASKLLPANVQAGTSYTLVLTDVGKRIEMTSASANTVEVPPNASVAFPIDAQIVVEQYGTGQTTIQAGAGVTINATDVSLEVPGQYAMVVLVKRGTNEWILQNGTAGGGGGSINSVSGTTNRITVTGTTDPVVDISSSYVGQNTITTLGTVGIGTWNASDIGLAYIAQGSALSVLGVSGNATADNASIAAGTDNQVLRRSGTALGFGAVNLASSNAVTGILPIANIATGTPDGTKFVRDDGTLATPSTSGAWALTGTSTLTGAATITSNSENQHTFNGTWTATANDSYHLNFAGSFTSRNTASDKLFGYRFTPTLTVNAGAPATQTLTAVDISPVFSGTATKIALQVGGLNGNLALQYPTFNPTLLRASSTTSDAMLFTASNGTRIAMFSNGDVQFGSMSTDAPSTSFSTGARFSVAQISTSNYGAAYFYPGPVSPTSGQNTGAHFAMSVNSSSGSATIRNVRIQTAGAFTSTATTTSQALNVRSIPNNMNIGGGYTDIFIDSDITQNTTSSVPWTGIRFSNTINQTSSGAGTLRAIDYGPTETALLGSHYFITNRSTTALSGFSTATPLSTVDIDGSVGHDITSTSADITAGVSHYTILVDASGAARTITLPASSGAARRIYVIKKIDSSGNSVTIDANSTETIDGVTTKSTSTQYAGWTIQCDGSNWHIIGTF